MYIKGNGKELKWKQPCWECSKGAAGGNCPWANSFQPVPGWDAKEVIVKHNQWSYKKNGKKVHRVTEIKSYEIYSCPLYEKEVEKSKEEKEAIWKSYLAMLEGR